MKVTLKLEGDKSDEDRYGRPTLLLVEIEITDGTSEEDVKRQLIAAAADLFPQSN